MTAIQVGRPYIITTYTYIYLGVVKSVNLAEIVLEQVARIYDTGRWGECLATGHVNEAEAYPDDHEAIIMRSAVVDCSTWSHSLIRESI